MEKIIIAQSIRVVAMKQRFRRKNSNEDHEPKTVEHLSFYHTNWVAVLEFVTGKFHIPLVVSLRTMYAEAIPPL